MDLDETLGLEDMATDGSILELSSYPNPFSTTTNIKYDLKTNTHVNLSIYNITGQLVNVLVDSTETAGSHTVVWNGTSSGGYDLADGMYILKLKTETEAQSFKLIFIK